MAPDPGTVVYYEEPMVEATILLPKEYMTPVINLCIERRGV